MATPSETTASPLMVDIMRVFYWFDEHLRARLAARGWAGVTRSQSLVLTNVANGVTRPSRIAENLGVSRQATSQLLAEMVNLGLLEMTRDPDDRRAQMVRFADSSVGIREDALQITRDLEGEIEQEIGTALMDSLRTALRAMPIR